MRGGLSRLGRHWVASLATLAIACGSAVDPITPPPVPPPVPPAPPPPPVPPPPPPPVPLTLTVTPGAVRLSARQGQLSGTASTATVTVTGDGAATLVWTAAKRKDWTMLITGTGTGSGPVVWGRQTTGLAVGTYVDTITVTASGATGSPALIVDTLVVTPAIVGSVAITTPAFPATFRVRAGDQVQLTAVVTSTDGMPMPQEPVVWTLSVPRVGSVSAAGLVTFRPDTGLGTNQYTVQASAGGKSATRAILSRDWLYRQVVDPVTLRTTHWATLDAEIPPSTHRPSLSFGCSDGLALSIIHHDGINNSGWFSYRFSGKAPQTVEWNELGGFRGVSAPSTPLAKAFWNNVPTSDSLLASILHFSSGMTEGVWLLRGWQNGLGKVRSHCP